MKLNKRYLFQIIIFSLPVIILLSWLNIQFNGKIIASSKGPDKLYSPLIQVREIPARDIVSFIMNDNPFYRFEYYLPNSKILFSANTYRGESFRANYVNIVWSNRNHAVVFLETFPVFTCEDGFWKKIK